MSETESSFGFFELNEGEWRYLCEISHTKNRHLPIQ